MKKVESKKITVQVEQKSDALKRYLERQEKARKAKDNNDIIGMPCIRSKDGNMKVRLEDKMEVWEEYKDTE